MKRWTIGDIHGNFEALQQCFQRSGMDYEKDVLISVGDIVDGHRYVYECVEELLKIKHLICIRGNHDYWTHMWLRTGVHTRRWTEGGQGTLMSYLKHCLGDKGMMQPNAMEGWDTNLNPGDIPESHKRFFDKQVTAYIDEHNNCFVHAGWHAEQEMKKQSAYVLMWDRTLITQAIKLGGEFKMKDNFNKIYLGHTPTTNWSLDEREVNGIIIPGIEAITTPIRVGNITNCDTGAGYAGPLTIVNIETDEYYQSDGKHYPGEQTR